MRKLDDLLLWRKSVDIVRIIYSLVRKLPRIEERNLADQLRRSTTSVSLNIAEGCASQNDKEFARFLKIARNSAAETVAALIICEELYRIDVSSHVKKVEEVIKMINGLINYLHSKHH